METNKIIKKRRLELGLTLKDVAEALSVAESTVLRYERNDIKHMGIDKITQLAKVLKCSPVELLGWDENQTEGADEFGADLTMDSVIEVTDEEDDPCDEEATVKIKLFGSLPAGVPLDTVTDVIGEEEIPAAWVEDGQQYLALKVNDLSLHPRYQEGDILIVKITPDVPDGKDAIVYSAGADATLRQLQKHADGSYTLKPYNPEYPPRTYPAGAEGVKILGGVVQMRRIVWQMNK